MTRSAGEGPILITRSDDRLSDHIRHSTLAKLTPSQLDALTPFRHELARMAEQAVRVRSGGLEPRVELTAVLRDVRESLLELERLRARPVAAPMGDLIEVDRPRRVAQEASVLLGMLAEWLEEEIDRLPEPPNRSETEGESRLELP